MKAKVLIRLEDGHELEFVADNVTPTATGVINELLRENMLELDDGSTVQVDLDKAVMIRVWPLDPPELEAVS